MLNFRRFVLLTQFSFNRACYPTMDFYTTSINVSLTYNIIRLRSKGPVLTLHISNTQEKVRHVEPRKRNRTTFTVLLTQFSIQQAQTNPTEPIQTFFFNIVTPAKAGAHLPPGNPAHTRHLSW